MTIENLSGDEFLFTSESVTEGHPDKICDQISDGVLDAVLTDDPRGRVACECLVNTGLVVVAGEISTDTYVDIPRIARGDAAANRLRPGQVRVRRGYLLGDHRDRRAVARHRPGRGHRVRGAHRPQRRGRAGSDRRRRPGNDVRLRGARDTGSDADADPDRAHARPSPDRGSQGGRDPLSAPRRQDPGDRSLRERSPRGGREAADLDPAQAGHRRRDADQARPVGARRRAGPARGVQGAVHGQGAV